MKTIITKAVYNYLQNSNYHIDYEYCGYASKDDATIARMIDLSELSIEDVQKIVEDEYAERLSEMNEVSVENMAKAMSISLCGAWIAKRSDITYGYDHSNRFFGGLRVGESTLFSIV